MSQDRRSFLKTTAKAGAITAVAGIAITACSNTKVEQKEVVKGKSRKQEVLYQKSKYWDSYYKVAY
ncbi:MAG: twin-arginine translocation signal domain-containing protein [Helicobacteraceae bacterium]|nr:twin-arginine translocation signal domain-containing protein [Helicobacteraceae bacterium]